MGDERRATSNFEQYAIRIDERSMVALECLGQFDFEIPYAGDEPENVLARAISGRSLHVWNGSYEAVWGAINDLSNRLDEQSREESDPERRRWWRQDSRALTALLLRLQAAQKKAERKATVWGVRRA